jgi:ribosomal protein S18 acetylase RimI-like enzyme
VIRRARTDDLDGIAAVHAGAWQAAYLGIVPARTLEAFTVASRREYWAQVRLDDRPPDRPIFVAVEDDIVVGFALCGRPPRDADMEFDAELYALNVDPTRWRSGIGRRLFMQCADHLGAMGCRNFYLWVFVANERARRSYESLGGTPLRDRVRAAPLHNIGVPEIPYAWNKLPIIAS